MVSYKELRKKEVICIKDCRRLGHVCDLEIDECKGCICKIIVPGCKGFWSTFHIIVSARLVQTLF